MQRLSFRTSGLLASLAAASAASAQPKLITIPIGDDMGSTGTKVAGIMYDSGLNKYVPYTWERGVGFSAKPNTASGAQSNLSCSADCSVLSMASRNESDWGMLNCFNGYCFGSMIGCVPGDPRPPESPCPVPSITHRWAQDSGWVNAGSFTRLLDAGTGRYYGGTRCDFDVNSPNDMSGDGRFIVGGAWWAPLTTSTGGPGFGLCGDFYAFRYDAQTGAFDQLPGSSTTTRADRVNYDGSVITGYSLGTIHNPDGTTDNPRQTCVWRNGVQTILDPYFYAKDYAAVNASGAVLAQGASPEFVASAFPGTVGARLVKWTYQAGAWVPANLGKPIATIDPNSGVPIECGDMWADAISDDGNTIVGLALYGPPPPSHDGIFRPFIWNPNINGGVPIDLQTYLNSLTPGSPMLPGEVDLTAATGISGDGTAILVGVYDHRNTCPPGFNAPRSLTTFSYGVVYLNGASIPCDPPRIALSTPSWSQTYDIRLGVALNVFASGSWPLNYQWQREDPAAPGVWTNLSDDCAGFVDSSIDPWAFEGTATSQLRVGTGEAGGGRAGRYRCVVSNPCGSVTSDPATVTFVVGACCIPRTLCSIDYQGGFGTGCTVAGGVWMGEGTACSPVDACNPPASGACCCGSHCSVTTAAACAGSSTRYAGDGTVCTPVSASIPCCRGDYNQSAAVSVQDIFDFLTGYFSNDPCADTNDTETISVQDIFDFLSAYFGGC